MDALQRVIKEHFKSLIIELLPSIKKKKKKGKCHVLMQPVKEEHLASKIIDTERSSLEYKYWVETMKMV